MPNRSSLTAALKRPLRAVEETVVTVVLAGNPLLPFIHLVPGIGNSAGASDLDDFQRASGLDVE